MAAYVGRRGLRAHQPKVKITPPKNARLYINQDVQKNSGNRPENIDRAQSFPPAAVITEHSFPASVQEVKAIENLSVFEIVKRRKVEDDCSAAKTAEQTNPLYGRRAVSQPAMREFSDLGAGISAVHPIARTFPVPRPDV
jgi:hypothetical protein